MTLIVLETSMVVIKMTRVLVKIMLGIPKSNYWCYFEDNLKPLSSEQHH